MENLILNVFPIQMMELRVHSWLIGSDHGVVGSMLSYYIARLGFGYRLGKKK